MFSTVKTALIWLSLPSLAYCMTPGIGFEGHVDVANVKFSSLAPRASNFSATSGGTYLVKAPILVTRKLSRATSVKATAYLSVYAPVSGEEQPADPILVYKETVKVSNVDTFQRVATFNLTTSSSWQDVYLRIVLRSSSPNRPIEHNEVEGVVISYNAETRSLSAIRPGVYSHEQNEAAHEEIDSEVKLGVREKDPEIESGQDPEDLTPGVPSWDKDIKVRQAAKTYANVNAKISYINDRGIKLPVRGVSVTASGKILSSKGAVVGSITDKRTLGGDGKATFRFAIKSGQSIKIDRIEAKLETSLYKVATRKTEADTFLTTIKPLTLTLNPWKVNVGQTKSYENTYPKSVANQAIWVQDVLQTLVDFSRNKVAATPALVNVWFPAVLQGTYFSPGSNPVYINIPTDDALDPTVIAHEYGHFHHYIARRKLYFDGGDGRPHYACGVDEFQNPSAGSNFEEGFATAFGLAALDGTSLVPSADYGVYCDFDPTLSIAENEEYYCTDYDRYTCENRHMFLQEGRIAAGIWDLFHRSASQFGPTDSDFGRGGYSAANTNVRVSPDKLFWKVFHPLNSSPAATNVAVNPANIKEYWYNLRTLLSSSSETAAWNLLTYNWADFPRTK